MRPIIESCTVILVGLWNTRLLNIKWIGDTLFPAQEVTGEFAMVPGQPDRFTAEDVRILPGEDRLVVAPVRFSDDLFARVEEKAIRILQMLQHTPLRAFGINFTFNVIEPMAVIDAMFATVEHDPLVQRLGDTIKTVVQRTFAYGDGVVNIGVIREDDERRIAFNYHWQVDNPADAVSKLTGAVLKAKEHALTTMVDSYKLSLDEEEGIE